MDFATHPRLAAGQYHMPSDTIDGFVSQLVGDVPHKRQRDPKDVEDSNYRRGHGVNGRRPFGKPLRAAFYCYLPDVPRTSNLPPDFARYYLGKIREVQEMQCWSRREQERLRVLERRWERRVRGVDARYNALGTAPGLTNKQRTKGPADRIAEARAQLEREGAKPVPPSPLGAWKPR